MPQLGPRLAPPPLRPRRTLPRPAADKAQWKKVRDLLVKAKEDWLSMSYGTVEAMPKGDFLATAHVDSVGIYLWANKTQFSSVALQGLDELAEVVDEDEAVVALPTIQAEFGVDRGGASLPYTATLVGFAGVSTDAGTVVWSNGTDLDPDVLCAEVTGVSVKRRLASARAS